MHVSSNLLVTASLLLSVPASAELTAFTKSDKRGLVFVPNDTSLIDDSIWAGPNSDLTWYYNYQTTPSSAYASLSQDEFEFVPQLWGAQDRSFLSEIQGLINRGRNISHVLTFNEPDGSFLHGGSEVSPSTAAALWIAEIEPLRELGIRVGAPAVLSSEGGFSWLASFFASCETQGTNCTVDFFPIHWYGNFEGLASHMGRYQEKYPNSSLWITEYALAHESLEASQDFFNTSTAYFDRLSFVERYTYFGSFRSDVSNVGPNAAMLTENGELTDIGSWYLGGSATGVVPNKNSNSTRANNGASLTMISGWFMVISIIALSFI